MADSTTRASLEYGRELRPTPEHWQTGRLKSMSQTQHLREPLVLSIKSGNIADKTIGIARMGNHRVARRNLVNSDLRIRVEDVRVLLSYI